MPLVTALPELVQKENIWQVSECSDWARSRRTTIISRWRGSPERKTYTIRSDWARKRLLDLAWQSGRALGYDDGTANEDI